MSDEILFIYCFFGGMGGLALLVFVMWKVMDFIDNRNDCKHHKEHPEYFRLYNDFSDKADTACHFYNTEIDPRKRKVDYMLRDEPYWPQEVREQKMAEVEKLRREIYAGECMYKGLDKEAEEARQKVVDYVHAHNIKWAGDWN